MKIKESIHSQQLLYYLISVLFVLFSFKADKAKSEYILPLAANSVCTADLDLDGDNDIVVGHVYSQVTNWTGITMMLNDENGYFGENPITNIEPPLPKKIQHSQT